MNNKSFRYASLSQNELQKRWNQHKNIIEGFINDNSYETNYLYVNEDAVVSVITKVDQRKEYFKFFHGLNMSEYKEAALIAFWYIKLQPIKLRSEQFTHKGLKEYDAINEKLAVYCILRTLRIMLYKSNKPTDELDSLSKKYIKELIYTFTYRDISKEALILLMETMAVFLGLDPYASDKLPKASQ